MTQPENGFHVQSSAISDRGLNERRPLNEDSFLADSSRGVFAVADGVGGAEAGEVASQTAVEVLDEAFRHQVDGTDIEDLMELAIQRANASIHQMAQEHAKFSMMATTIVALHLNGNTATFGHVGDSRLYRLTPGGQLLRETEDHSVVEEEVRAGRMTPEQAANHPSKNVISRALGAEDDVEVDMKTIEIEKGTQFLLCTDGITRHIPDYELRQLLIINNDLNDVCEELKRRCFERGAEDNLTAVLVRVGDAIPMEQRLEELERTISPETEAINIPPDVVAATEANAGGAKLIPASRVAFPGPSAEAETEAQQPLNISPPQQKSSSGSSFGRILVFLLFIAAAGGAFYAGRRYQGPLPFMNESPTPTPAAVTQPTPESVPASVQVRQELDSNPGAWLANRAPAEVLERKLQSPLDSPDPQFLYLYGRASLLTGNMEQAARAFEMAITKAKATSTPENATVLKDATIGLAATSLKSEKERAQAMTHLDEMLRPPAPAPASTP